MYGRTVTFIDAAVFITSLPSSGEAGDSFALAALEMEDNKGASESPS